MSSVLTTPAGYWYVAFSWTFKLNTAQATRGQRQALAGRCHWPAAGVAAVARDPTSESTSA